MFNKIFKSNKKTQKENPEWWHAYSDYEEKENNTQFQAGSFRNVLREIICFPWMLGSGLVFTVLSTVFFVLQPKVLAYIIDEVILNKKKDLLVFSIFLFLGLEFLRVMATFFQEYIFNSLGQRVMQNLRVRVFSHIQALPMGLLDRVPAGKLVTRVTNDVASLADMFTSGFISIIGNIILILSLIAAIFVVNIKIGLIILVVFPVVVFSSFYFTMSLKVAYREARSKLSALNVFLVENISGIKIVHLFNRQKEHLARFHQLNDWYTHAQISSIRVFSYFQPVITICTGLSMALVIWFGGVSVTEGVLTLGSFTMLTTYTISIFKPIKDMADRWNMFLSGMASAERIFSILKWQGEEHFHLKEEKATHSEALGGRIEFQNVWFAYQDENWVLKDLNLVIEKGERIGIVGPTGSGKTTFIQLLLRFYEPTRGKILIDGKDIRLWEKRALRKHFGLIQQDVFLFSGSIQENINLWNAESTLDSMSEEKVSNKFPEIASEFNKNLHERGVNLSLGQRQVLSFLRAACHKPDIWIMDEASAFMDSTSELKLEELFHEHSQGKTTLTIAHRLSSVKNAHQILVLLKGEVVEKGTHAELMRKNGLYHRLFSYQQNVDEVGLLS